MERKIKKNGVTNISAVDLFCIGNDIPPKFGKLLLKIL